MALDILLGMALGGLSGALLGLIPFFVGRSSGRPDLGRTGLICSIGVGASLVLSWALPAVVVGFVIAIIVKGTGSSAPSQPYYPPPPPPPPPVPGPGAPHKMGVKCVSGPLMGQTYSVGPNGMIVGRDHDCAIRFPADQPGISRHHCSLRWDGGTLVLTDMGSSHGTFLHNGTRLYSQQPTPLPVGTCFYLVNTGIMFQVVII